MPIVRRSEPHGIAPRRSRRGSTERSRRFRPVLVCLKIAGPEEVRRIRTSAIKASFKLSQHVSLLAGVAQLWGGEVYAGPRKNGTWAFTQVAFKY